MIKIKPSKNIFSLLLLLGFLEFWGGLLLLKANNYSGSLFCPVLFIHLVLCPILINIPQGRAYRCYFCFTNSKSDTHSEKPAYDDKRKVSSFMIQKFMFFNMLLSYNEIFSKESIYSWETKQC